MVINGIDTKDISVVVQGAVVEYASICLASIREHLPGAEIVLSTWKGSNVDGLDFDKLVLSDDPGGFDCMNDDFFRKNNIDRQVVSTRAGLQASKKKYAVKLRTDFSLSSHGFLNWWGKYAKRSTESWFTERLISCTIFARNARSLEWQLPAHPSDFFFFGLRSDLLELFDMPPISDEERIWFAQKFPKEFRYELHRFVPEQFLWMNLLRKHIACKTDLPEHAHDVRKETIRLTERSFAGNLVLLSPEQLGIDSAKNLFNNDRPDTCYTHFDWLGLYAWYCGKNPFPYCVYRLKTGLRNAKTKLVQGASMIWRKIGGRMKEPLKKLAHRLMLLVKKHVKPRVSERRWARWKLYYQNLRLFRLPKTVKEQYICCADGPELSDETLSVVVQGAVTSATKEALLSIRRVLPNAEIVLSTWEGSDTTGLDYDRLVISPDPGSDGLIRRYPHKQIHNASREIISTLAGAKESTRFFCLKIRSDMQILSNGFVAYYNQFSRYTANSSYFERRVMVNGTTTTQYGLNVGDWWYLGTRKDICKLFDLPLYPKEETPYFEQERNKEKKAFLETIVCRYIPETYIIYSFLRKNDKDLPVLEDQTKEFHFSGFQHKLLSENLICIEPTLSGIVLPKARNVENPYCFRYFFPLERWYKFTRQAGMLPRVKLPSETENVLEQVYLKQPRWCDVSNWINIVKNYAKIQQEIINADADHFEKEDMSFLVCGRIEHVGEWNTRRCLKSIRRFFSKSKIILATWEDENIELLTGLYDEIVLCQRPNGERRDIYLCTSGSKEYDTINDQGLLVSQALQKVNTKYVVKMRTDSYLINDNLLPFYKKWTSALNKRECGYKVFSKRVLTSQYFVNNPRAFGGAYAYMLSDCIQFGLVDDVKKLWCNGLIPDEEMNWFEEHPNCNWENPERFNYRYNTEQFLFLPVVQKALPDLPYPQWYFDRKDERYVFENEKVLASNVITGDRCLLGVATKFDTIHPGGLVTFERLLEIYLENVDPTNQDALDYLKERY